MPMYDYTCKNCGHKFEELVFSNSATDEEISCPNCGEHRAKRQLSAPRVAVGGGGNSTFSSSSRGGCNSTGGFT